jgi:hypothetical protein
MRPPEKKTGRPDRATRDTTIHAPNDSAPSDEAQAVHAVVCRKADGRRVPFQTYDTLAKAEAVAQRLRGVGCACSVEATR